MITNITTFPIEPVSPDWVHITIVLLLRSEHANVCVLNKTRSGDSISICRSRCGCGPSRCQLNKTAQGPFQPLCAHARLSYARPGICRRGGGSTCCTLDRAAARSSTIRCVSISNTYKHIKALKLAAFPRPGKTNRNSAGSWNSQGKKTFETVSKVGFLTYKLGI